MREASFSMGDNSCLVCSATPKRSNPVKYIQQSIEVLRIRCPLLGDCDWKGELSEAETHLNDCSFVPIQCKKCEHIFPRREREEHRKNNCPKRNIHCEYCVLCGKAEDLYKHLQECYGFPISCPNECGAEFPREELSEHRSECELEMVTCPYKEYGCKAEPMLRNDLLIHKKENIVEHTDMSLVEIKQLKDENARLKKEQNEMKSKEMRITMKQLDGVEWKIENLHSWIVAKEYEGPIFYLKNYKLRIYCLFFFWNPHFYLKRIAGKFDKNLGIAYITHYRIVNVNERSYESKYEEGIMNYQLKIMTKSNGIMSDISFGDLPNCLLRFYFDVNSECFQTHPHPVTPKSEVEYDMWKSYSDSDEY